MSSIEINLLELRPSEKVARKLFDSADLALDLFPVQTEIAADLFRIEEAVFNSGGRRGGGSWAGLKENTAERKGSTQILRGTANYNYGDGPGDFLFKSLTEPGAEFQILDFTPETIIFGTDRPWAGVQQGGSSYHNRPARPFLRILPIDVNRWAGFMTRHIMRPFRV